jgi:putative membrane protein
MWVERKRSWIRTVLLSGFALPSIWTRTLTVTAISIVVTLLYELVPRLHYSITPIAFTLVGLPLGIFLGFRNNTSYDRFWEGRKLWGSLVNTSRSLTRQILTLHEVGPDAIDRDREALRTFELRAVRLLIAYVHALRHHLRDSDPKAMLREHVPDEAARLEDEDNVPIAMLQRLGDLFAEARGKGWISPYHVPILEASLTALTDIQGACERIKLTPIPYSYTVLMHRIVAGFCGLLPLGIMEAVGWVTPFIVLAISYTFFGLDAIGEEVEQPFGFDGNDLPLEAISRTIERNLRRRIGDPQPPALDPTPDGQLL